ncbi:uncharacterized protein LOC129751206 isoform X2 [Uranotaenia lowii]|uniref:uncharacterized protein LOC129751206 isoform X2 n=1 Tax=Uranotaenia lowii TaxID=190385 RepID=UPI002478D8EB|nr:uncharacterized protein LOC129751206 isoform X2 [Uranotaenia lowii]
MNNPYSRRVLIATLNETMAMDESVNQQSRIDYKLNPRIVFFSCGGGKAICSMYLPPWYPGPAFNPQPDVHRGGQLNKRTKVELNVKQDGDGDDEETASPGHLWIDNSGCWLKGVMANYPRLQAVDPIQVVLAQNRG